MVKGKRVGSSFESEIRKLLDSSKYYVIPKGVSTPGVDIIAIIRDYCLLLELKTFKKLLKEKEEEKLVLNLFKKLVEEKREIHKRTSLFATTAVIIKYRLGKGETFYKIFVETPLFNALISKEKRMNFNFLHVKKIKDKEELKEFLLQITYFNVY